MIGCVSFTRCMILLLRWTTMSRDLVGSSLNIRTCSPVGVQFALMTNLYVSDGIRSNAVLNVLTTALLAWKNACSCSIICLFNCGVEWMKWNVFAEINTVHLVLAALNHANDIFVVVSVIANNHFLKNTVQLLIVCVVCGVYVVVMCCNSLCWCE